MAFLHDITFFILGGEREVIFEKGNVYLWHSLAMIILGEIHYKGPANPAMNSICVFLIVCAITIVIAHFSYKFLEEPYFKKKATNPIRQPEPVSALPGIIIPADRE